MEAFVPSFLTWLGDEQYVDALGDEQYVDAENGC